MLTLTKKTEYALLALSHLTVVGAIRAVNTKEIAEQHDIPLELLAKILQKLAKARLIVSTSGPTGGYRLAKPAAEISVVSVVEVMDGLPALVPCLKADGSVCGQSGKCTIRTPLERINTRIFQMLSTVTLDDITRDDGSETIGFAERRARPLTTASNGN